MTQATREKLAKHYKDIGVPDSENPYASDLKENTLGHDTIVDEEPVKIRKKRSLW